MKFSLGKYFLILLTFSFSCEKSNEVDKNIDYINVYFIQKGTTYPIRIDCSFVADQERSIEEIHYKKITNNEFIDKFLSLKNVLTESKDSKPVDSKIKVFIKYKNNKKDSICFGAYHGIEIDGVKMNDSEELLEVLKNEINYDNTFRSLDEILNSK
ncbi:hypothetical protein [Kordia sp.]|uniref:hypothetical protein n=1 Tax=Kordia sp. TaxID=1965332 RepID=UPI0025C04178|nr:hypothetical protein [Kordia sp.]MCH2195852.1 hypothetical protein [Kordia sp.]